MIILQDLVLVVNCSIQIALPVPQHIWPKSGVSPSLLRVIRNLFTVRHVFEWDLSPAWFQAGLRLSYYVCQSLQFPIIKFVSSVSSASKGLGWCLGQEPCSLANTNSYKSLPLSHTWFFLNSTEIAQGFPLIPFGFNQGPYIPHSTAQAAPESEPESGPKQPQPALPMQALTATGKAKMNKLSPQQIAELKAQVDDAVTNTSKDRSTKRKPKEDSTASDPKNGKAGEAGPRPPRAPRGTFARKASQALLDSLVTPAPPAKKPSPKAKAKSKQAKVSKVKKLKAESKKAARKGSKPNKENTSTKAGYM